MHKNLNFKQELYRKLIHLSNISIPVFLMILSQKFLLIITFPIFILCLLADYLRLNNKRIKKIYNFFFSGVTRPIEEETFTGASYCLFSIVILLGFFSKKIVMIALTICAISDTLAAIIGMKYGKLMVKNKSAEGCLAFFISSFIICYLIFSLNYFLSVSTAILSTIIELFTPWKLNDNITVPILTALYLSIFI